jgi:hypothetical protein
MTKAAFQKWVLHYCGFFGIANEKGLAMVNGWFWRVESMGLERADLDWAMAQVCGDPPKYLSDHAAAFWAAVQLRRSAVAAQRSMATQQNHRQAAADMAPPGSFRKLLAEKAPHLLTSRMKRQLEGEDGSQH